MMKKGDLVMLFDLSNNFENSMLGISNGMTGLIINKYDYGSDAFDLCDVLVNGSVTIFAQQNLRVINETG